MLLLLKKKLIILPLNYHFLIMIDQGVMVITPWSNRFNVTHAAQESRLLLIHCDKSNVCDVCTANVHVSDEVEVFCAVLFLLKPDRQFHLQSTLEQARKDRHKRNEA